MTDPYDIAITHPVVTETCLDETLDYGGDRFGNLMSVGFTLCDTLAIRGEGVPDTLNYRSAGLPNIESLEDERGDMEDEHTILHMAWPLLKSFDSDAIRDYLLNVWQPAYDYIVECGEDY